MTEQDYGNQEPAKRGALQEAATSYLEHVVDGKSIRSIAQKSDVHPSTIMRRIRKIEGLRDDPALDQYLTAASKTGNRLGGGGKGGLVGIGTEKILEEDKVILRRMSETGAILVVSKGLKKAVVMRTNRDGQRTRTAVVNAHLAGTGVINDWLRCTKAGNISLYEITEAGRSALKRAIAEDTIKGRAPTGFSEAPTVFSEQHKDWGERAVREDDGVTRKKTGEFARKPADHVGAKER